jgi:hypothetical protein
MWGEERGVIPVNQQTLFGNVLPDSIRSFSFSWEGEWSLSDIGRYTAIATLAYGESNRQFTSVETSFWIFPWREVGVALLVFFGLLSIVVWGIKAYIRRVILLSGVTPVTPTRSTLAQVDTTPANDLSSSQPKPVSVVAPLEAGILDLRSRLSETSGFSRIGAVMLFVTAYKVFFGIVMVGALLIWSVVWFISSANESERAYQVTIEGVDSDVTIDSETLRFEEMRQVTQMTDETATSSVPVFIVNRSGEPGLAADTGLYLEQNGFIVDDIETEFGSSERVTVIVYSSEYQSIALELSQLLGGALLSAYADADDAERPITIFVGQDIQNTLE